MARDRIHRAARRQVGALCWRLRGDGLAFVLVTSRDTGRWVTPKGNRMAGLDDATAAAEEAYEEAGVRGVVDPSAIGVFQYDKRLSGKAQRVTSVDVFALEVRSELKDWPEEAQRTRRWFSRADAMEAVDEPELKALIAAFVPD